MTENFMEIKGERRNVKYPHLLKEYLEKNCKKDDNTLDDRLKAIEFAGLIPIAVGILGVGLVTWWLTKGQVEGMEEFLE